LRATYCDQACLIFIALIARGKQDVLQVTAYGAMALPRLRRATKFLSIGRMLQQARKVASCAAGLSGGIPNCCLSP
jgi:hypothetical protein